MAATLADVAARAGVSTATVSRVLNGNYPVAPGTRQQVLHALREVDYVVNGPARALAAATSDVLGVIVNDISDPFFGIQARGLQRAAAAADLLALICSTGGSPAEELRYIELLLRQRVRSIVLVGGGCEQPAHARALGELVGRATARGVTVVTCGRAAPTGTDAVSVVFDNRGGARALTAHLVALGHHRIGYVLGPRDNSTTRERREGHRAALAGAALRPDDALEVRGDFSRRSGFDAGRELLRRDPALTAVVAANDLMALGVIAALRTRDVRVPGTVSVAGFDDLPAALDVVPALTTVRLPLLEAAQRAGRVAAGQEDVAAGATVWMPAELLVRESVGPPRSDR